MVLRRFPLLACLPILAVHAQNLRLGVKAGVPLTGYFETGRTGSRYSSADYSAATRRYTVGATVEWRWTPRFGFEADALYHRMGYVARTYAFDTRGAEQTAAIDVKGNSWDFPVLAKYRFGGGVRLFVAGGGALRYVGPVRGRGNLTTHDLIAGTTVHAAIDTSEPNELRKRFYPGLVAAGGLEAGRKRIHLVPELRYTHWTANIAREGGALRFRPGQLEFLLGILF